MVLSTTPAGTISQTARGFASFLANSASEAVPTAFSFTSSATAFADLSNTTHWWPPFKQAAHHVRSHPAEADHSELHGLALHRGTMFRSDARRGRTGDVAPVRSNRSTNSR